MNILVTGGTGFISKHLVLALIQRSDVKLVIVLIRQRNGFIEELEKSNKVLCIQATLDIYKETDFFKYNINEIDFIFHLAWAGTRGNDRDNKELQLKNYKYSFMFLQNAIKYNVKGIFLGGSQAEYGTFFDNNIITENTVENPDTQYGIYKLELFNSLKKYCSDNVKIIDCRFVSIYGSGENNNTLIMYCIKQMKNNKTVNVNNCSNLWNYLYIDDAIDALILLIDKYNVLSEYEIINICGSDNIPLKEYILMIKKVLDSKSAISFGENISNTLCYSNKKLRDIAGWDQKISFVNGIERIMNK